jgi:hypothetical protein
MADQTHVAGDAFTDDQIHHLLRTADRLGFGIRPEGFVLINRERLIETKGLTKANVRLVDHWVRAAGGDLQPLRRQTPEESRRHYQRARRRPETMVWGIPANALRAEKPETH